MKLSAGIALSNMRLTNYWKKTINGKAHTHIATSRSTYAVTRTAVEAEVSVA